jgi:hypothetical protein
VQLPLGEYETESPESDVAVTVNVELYAALAGACCVTVMAWLFVIVKVCCTWGAGFQSASPSWFPSTTQVPTVIKVTNPPPFIEQIVVAVASIVMDTGNPDVAVAVGVYEPPTLGLTGGAPNVTV